MTGLQSLATATLQRARSLLVTAFDLHDERDAPIAPVVALWHSQLDAELDRRAQAIPSDVRRRENLKAACASAEALLGGVMHERREEIGIALRGMLDRIRRNLESAIADDDRVANGGEFKP